MVKLSPDGDGWWLVYLVYPLHVVTKLFQILDVSITDLTDDKVSLPPALALPGLAGLVDGG